MKAHGQILGDEKRGTELEALVFDALHCAALERAPGAAFYVCFTWRTFADFERALRALALDIKACIVWDKKSIGLGFSNYRPQHEMIFFAPDPDAGSTVYGKQHELIFYAPGATWLGGKSETDVWQCSRGNTSGYVHPTQKPVELIERALNNSSAAGAVVFDCFGGSGSTLIACEKTGRSGRLLELDPKFVDVIVRRWQAFTGERATLAGSDRTFDEIAASRAA